MTQQLFPSRGAFIFGQYLARTMQELSISKTSTSKMYKILYHSYN